MDSWGFWAFILVCILIWRYNKDHPVKLTKKQIEQQKKMLKISLWILGVFVSVVVIFFIWIFSVY